jgi:hypothetical protein
MRARCGVQENSVSCTPPCNPPNDRAMPEGSHGWRMQDPAVFTESYTAPATLSTSACKVAKNTTDGWSKQLYSAGDPVLYASRADFMAAMMNGTQTDIWTPSVGPTSK